MAAITKSAVKTRSRGGTPFFFVIAVILCLVTMQSFLTLNPEYLSDSSETLADSPLLAIPIEKKVAASSPSSGLKQVETSAPKLSFPRSNEDYFRNPSASMEKKIYSYHRTLSVPDGSEGVVILDMFLGHAYAFHQGFIYGGSCALGNELIRGPENGLISAIGLQDFLQFACPSDLKTKDRKKTIPYNSYTADGTRAFTPEYVDLLRSVIKYPKRQESQSKTNVIVVHMSRGKKFTPCRRKPHRGFQPYLPNKHYQVSTITVKTWMVTQGSLFLWNHSQYEISTFVTGDNCACFLLASSFISAVAVAYQQVHERWLRKQSDNLFSVIVLRKTRRIPRKRLRAPYWRGFKRCLEISSDIWCFYHVEK